MTSQFKDKRPFYSTRTEEERAEDKREVISVSLNPQEREVLERIKELLNIKDDSRALKIGAEVGLNVLRGLFSEKTLRYISSLKRQRLSDVKTLPEALS